MCVAVQRGMDANLGLSTESMSPDRSRCVRLWSVGPDGGRCTHVRLDRSRLARSSLALASARFRALSLALDTCRRRCELSLRGVQAQRKTLRKES